MAWSGLKELIVEIQDPMLARHEFGFCFLTFR